MTFALDLQKFAAKAGARADAVVAGVTAEIIAKVDLRSPVGDPTKWKNKPPAGYVGGRFRGNWQLGIGTIPAGVLNKVDPSGRGTVTANIAEIPRDAAGRVYFLVNNLPYSRRLEEGHSTQAPAGIVGLTVIEFQGIVDRAVARAAA